MSPFLHRCNVARVDILCNVTRVAASYLHVYIDIIGGVYSAMSCASEVLKARRKGEGETKGGGRNGGTCTCTCMEQGESTCSVEERDRERLGKDAEI